MARVFLSYATENLALAHDVHDWLVRAGHDVFFARDNRDGIPVGDAWKQRLYRELNRVDAVVCVVTDAYLDSTWCTAEVAIADSRGCLLIPLRAQKDVTHRLIEDQQHTSADPAVAREQVLTRLRLLDSNGRGEWRDGENPYPGLEPFTADRGKLFFGRSREVRELSARVRTARGLRAVVGPSGCGKSSLVLAGLLPLMASDPTWLVVDPWSPGDDPVYALATALTRTAQRLSLGWALEEVQRRLQAPRGLRALADELLIAHGGKRVLLAVDQAEELFGPAVDVERRDRFVELLATRGPVGVTATVRSEYLDDLGALLRAPIETYLLGPLAKDMLRAAIEEPARIAGLRLEPELSDRLMADTESGDALPLLAFTLQLLAEGRSRGDTITVAAYDALGGKNDHLGGLHAVLADHADEALVAATGSSGLGRDAVLAGLVRLVSMDGTGRWARRPVDPATLSTPMRVAVAVFVDHRLLTAERLVQFAHEALLTAWPPLAGAIEEHGKALRTARAVEQAAVEWVGAERADGYLWDDERHAETIRALGGSPVQLDLTGREFLAATEVRIQRARRLERLRRTRAVAVLSALLAVVVLVAGVAAAVQASKAQGERDAAVRELIARAEAVRAADPQQALRLVLAAHRLAPSGESAASLARTLTMNSYAATLRGHTSSIFSAAFSPDRRLLASGDGDDHTLRLWDVSDLAHPRALGQPITDHTTWVQGAAFAPDGHTLATASSDELILWNVDDPEHPRKLATIGEYKERERITDSMGIAFSPDGKVLISTHGGAVRLWDVTQPDQRTQIDRPLGEHMDTYSDVAYSPDGRVMALVLDRADEGSVLRLYDATNPRLPRFTSQWRAVNHPFTAVAFVPGKAVLATVRQASRPVTPVTSCCGTSPIPPGRCGWANRSPRTPPGCGTWRSARTGRG